MYLNLFRKRIIGQKCNIAKKTTQKRAKESFAVVRKPRRKKRSQNPRSGAGLEQSIPSEVSTNSAPQKVFASLPRRSGEAFLGRCVAFDFAGYLTCRERDPAECVEEAKAFRKLRNTADVLLEISPTA